MKATKNKTAHTSPNKLGMGDHYGSGVRNKIGKIRDNFPTIETAPKRIGKKPKSLA